MQLSPNQLMGFPTKQKGAKKARGKTDRKETKRL